MEAKLFKPKINTKYKSTRTDAKCNDKRKKIEHLSKWEQLYMMGMERPKYTPKTKDDILFEKEAEEYTFQPNVRSPIRAN